MFSYLRPHHRRTPSNPTSPAEPSPSFDQSLYSNHTHPLRYNDAALQEKPVTSSPPSLPPIARISSPEASNEDKRVPLTRNSRPQQDRGAVDVNMQSRDTYNFGNHPRLPFTEGQRPGSAGNVPTKPYLSPPPSRLQASSSGESQKTKTFAGGHNFVSNPDAQSRQIQAGRRPNGARMPSPPPTNAQSTFEVAQPRSGKARLNLLNPMSLLARRRTSQAVAQLTPEAIVSSRNGRNDFSENFDPRIRGTLVHDFSAPRPTKRNLSSNDIGISDGTNSPRQFLRSPNPDGQGIDENPTSPWSGGNHTPVFTENFEEEQYPAAGPHVRKANDLADLPLPKPPYARETPRPVGQHTRPSIKEVPENNLEDVGKPSNRKPAPDRPPPVPPKTDAPLEPRRVSIDPTAAGSTPEIAPSTSRKGRPRGISEVSAKDGIPRHMKSTSSRFSFDIRGAAEQERLLEDRHRKKAMEKKAEAEGYDRHEDEFEHDYDFDEMDDDDGLEERIPGVNADFDDEDDLYEELIPGVNTDIEEIEQNEPSGVEGTLDGFTFQQSLGSPLSPSSPGMASTPRDANGEVIGFALTKNYPHQPEVLSHDASTPPISPESKPPPTLPGIQGLGLHGIDMPHNFHGQNGSILQAEDKRTEFPRPATLDDDDLYFDDGIISGPGESDETVEFDESIFDNNDTDEYGRPLRPLSSIPTLYSPPSLTADPSPSFNKALESVSITRDSSNPISPSVLPRGSNLAPQPSISEQLNCPIPPIQENTGSLTQDTLAAYQSALAAAAFAAAANGKFRRDSVTSNRTTSEAEENHPSLIPDSSHASQNYEPFSPSYELEDDFDYDDALEDDAIIAAANAEALANDSDGFYGQEFGFYSAPSASEATYANGGYFGPRGVEGVNRSQSGRLASREPNLTPITERSEYSNRNSFMSLNMHGPGSVTSPGLAQLAGMMRSPDFDGDMSLDALLKLRNRAWGGSQASLHSSNGSPRSAGGVDDGSPVAQIPPWRGQGHRRKNSGFSVVSELNSGVQSEQSSAPASPSLTISVPALDTGKTPVEREEKENQKLKAKHRYTGSAESISYSKEEDPVAGERWILERRRTAESGEVQLLGREVISGGRI